MVDDAVPGRPCRAGIKWVDLLLYHYEMASNNEERTLTRRKNIAAGRTQTNRKTKTFVAWRKMLPKMLSKALM